MTDISNDSISNWNAVHGTTYGDAIDKITGFYNLTPEEAGNQIEQAIDEGKLDEDTSGTYPRLRIPDCQSKKNETDKTESGEANEDDTVPDDVHDWLFCNHRVLSQ